MALYDGEITYNGMPLFRGAIMNTGSIVPANHVDGIKGQAVYHTVVRNGGCLDAQETRGCLHGLDYARSLNAANSVPSILDYNSVAESYLPRPDGMALTESAEQLAMKGKYASVSYHHR